MFNRSNQVIIARDGNRSVFTMINDYQGSVKDFARIVPIPVVPKREDIRIGYPSIVKNLTLTVRRGWWNFSTRILVRRMLSVLGGLQPLLRQ
ncbi:DUF2330 domain-containing protein (plasmid) [Deinococcus sp. QL22]|nr:DUF2330 domain-containing protein [Deinococcus sp. QL22]UQN10094.1 DUF2330 domain-containing protein [Deinococcus sp. QL22]